MNGTIDASNLTATINGTPVQPILDSELLPVLSINTERDVQDLGPGYRRRESWRHVDSNGHVHQYVDGATPTLERVEENIGWCETCHDEHGDVRMACRECGETVKPGMDYRMHNQYVMGSTTSLEGEFILTDETLLGPSTPGAGVPYLTIRLEWPYQGDVAYMEFERGRIQSVEHRLLRADPDGTYNPRGKTHDFFAVAKIHATMGRAL